MAELQENLPAGWECKMDALTGRYYFVNHQTKSTTWEDPRNQRQPQRSFHGTPKHFSNVAVDHIPLQAARIKPLQHGSPDLRRNYVYPSYPCPIQAFQVPGHNSPKTNTLQDMKHLRMSPLTVRNAKLQETSMTETDELVTKINTMFPTVSETHIRMLLKKYHGREALVVSALQVEKNPITTPGPCATPPPMQRHQVEAQGRRDSALGPSPARTIFRSSPRQVHSSPKLKLRYMKSLFPQAEETVILETLYGNESNIQKTTEKLKEMGFEKKDTVKVAQQKMEAKIEERKSEESTSREQPVVVVVKQKTSEEKQALKDKLKERYKDVVEQLIVIALESVDYNEIRAAQILDIMVQENTQKQEEMNQKAVEEKTKLEITEVDSKVTAIPISQSRQSLKSLMKADKVEKDKCNGFSRVVEESSADYKSSNITNTNGPNPTFIQGANNKLLLEDYVKYQGPNAALRKGAQGLAKGPNRSLLSNRSYQPCGSNSDLRKGTKFGLAKGSIFTHLKSIVVGESRTK